MSIHHYLHYQNENDVIIKQHLLNAYLEYDNDEGIFIHKSGFALNAHQHLLNEVIMYTICLSDLQGICIPKYYGCRISLCRWECIATSYCGVRIDQVFNDVYIPENICQKMFDSLKALHNRNVTHNDVALRN